MYITFKLHYITLHYIPLHYMTLDYIGRHCITLHTITLHDISLHYIKVQYIHTYIHTDIQTCIHTYIHTCIHTYLLIHMYMCICIYTERERERVCEFKVIRTAVEHSTPTFPKSPSKQKTSCGKNSFDGLPSDASTASLRTASVCSIRSGQNAFLGVRISSQAPCLPLTTTTIISHYEVLQGCVYPILRSLILQAPSKTATQTRAPKDHLNIRILPNMVSGFWCPSYIGHWNLAVISLGLSFYYTILYYTMQ